MLAEAVNLLLRKKKAKVMCMRIRAYRVDSASRPTVQDTSLLVSETGFLGADDLIFKTRQLAKFTTSVSSSRYTPCSNQ